MNLDPYVASIIFAVDRFESKTKIEKWLEDGNVVIVDRYVSASQIHQGGKIKNPRERKIFFEWIEKVEYEIFKLPKPDLILYLDVSAEVSKKLNQKNKQEKKYLSGRADVHEESQEHLKKARLSAFSAISKNNKWKKINCEKNGNIMTKEEISDIIFKEVNRII